jgi:hypothetical protein
MGIGGFIFDPRDLSVMAISRLIQSTIVERTHDCGAYRLESVIMTLLALLRCSADTGVQCIGSACREQ